MTTPMCPRCHQPISFSDDYCPHENCRAPLGPVVRVHPPKDESFDGAAFVSGIMVGAAGALLCVAIAVAVYLYFYGG